MSRRLFALAVVVVLVSPGIASAQVKQLGADATSQDFISGLKPPGDAPGLKFRGIRVLNANPSDSAAGTSAPAVAVDIRFALNSAALSDTAKKTLAQIGAALKSDQLAPYHFRVEGHTDTSGKPEHNLVLSKERAEAVRSYLIDQLGIDSARLDAVGRGEAALLDPDHPQSPVNRRVQIINLGG